MHYILYFTVIKEIGIHIFILSSMGKNQKRISRKKIIDFEFNYVSYMIKKSQVLVICFAVSVHKNQSGLEYRPIRKQYLEI